MAKSKKNTPEVSVNDAEAQKEIIEGLDESENTPAESEEPTDKEPESENTTDVTAEEEVAPEVAPEVVVNEVKVDEGNESIVDKDIVSMEVDIPNSSEEASPEQYEKNAAGESKIKSILENRDGNH